MIKIIWKKNFLEVEGHSNYKEKGKDIICAAISSLICSSAEIWKNNNKFIIVQDQKIPLISFKLLNFEKNNLESQQILFLFLQIQVIAKKYPKFISISSYI